MSWTLKNGGIIDTGDEIAEGTPAAYDFDFEDENGVAYTPASDVTMKVTDGAGTEVEAASTIAAASSIEVTTEASTNDIASGGLLTRIILLSWTAITTRFPAPGVLQRCEVHYKVQQLVSVADT